MQQIQPVTAADLTAALNRHPAVKGCSVMLQGDRAGDFAWLAYLSMAPADETPFCELQEYLRHEIGIETPVLFVRLESLPALALRRRAA